MIFLNPYTHTFVRVSGNQKCLFSRKYSVHLKPFVFNEPLKTARFSDVFFLSFLYFRALRTNLSLNYCSDKFNKQSDMATAKKQTKDLWSIQINKVDVVTTILDLKRMNMS